MTQVLVSGKFSQYGRKSVVARNPELLKVKKHGTHMALLFQKYSYSFHDAVILKSLCLTLLFIEQNLSETKKVYFSLFDD